MTARYRVAGADDVPRRRRGLMTLRQIILLQVCRETLDRARRAGWRRHDVATATTADACAWAADSLDRANATADAMVHLVRTVVETAWRDIADDAAVARFMTRFINRVDVLMLGTHHQRHGHHDP